MIETASLKKYFQQPALEIDYPFEGFDPQEKERILARFSTSNYYSSFWKMDKVNSDRNPEDKYIFYFDQFSVKPELEDYVKCWILDNLLDRKSIAFCSSLLSYLRTFFNNIRPDYPVPSDLTFENIDSFYHFLFGKDQKNGVCSGIYKWNALKDFLKRTNQIDLVSQMNKYIVPKGLRNRERNFDKLIPESVLAQLDALMNTERIPLSYRVIYWTLRLIPNRISEVTSMRIDCLKKLNETTYVLSIPTFKQSGPFDKGQIRLIIIIYEGMGKFLVDLIQHQVDFTRKHVKDPQFLFYDYQSKFNVKNKTYILQKDEELRIIGRHLFSDFLYRLPYRFDLKDDDGNLAHISSHMFRHHAISDRINSKFFRPIDIMELTGHHNITMIEHFYYHPDYAATYRLIQENDLERTPVLFKGRIISGREDVQYEKILKRKFAFEIKNLGVCSDSRQCFKDRFQCLNCSYLMLDAENLDYFKEQKLEWEKKLEIAQRMNSESFIENCQCNIKLFETAIERILISLTDLDIDLVEF